MKISIGLRFVLRSGEQSNLSAEEIAKSCCGSNIEPEASRYNNVNSALIGGSRAMPSDAKRAVDHTVYQSAAEEHV